MMPHRKHALVIGGTGMLRNVCHYLNDENWFVSVVGRRMSKLEIVKKTSIHPEKISPISVDYHQYDVFKRKLFNAFEMYGFPQLIVSWIHSSAPDALGTLLNVMEQANHTWRLFHIQSSANVFTKENTSVSTTCLYRRVYLGFVLDQHTSRWLTHDEISQGVIDAIKTDREETVVGTLEPWDRRP